MTLCDCLITFSLAFLLCSTAASAVLPTEKPSMSVRIEAGEYRAFGRAVNVPKTVILPVDPPAKEAVKGEEVVLSDEQPRMYQGGTVLAKTLGPVDKWTRLPYAINPDSVRIYSGDLVGVEGRDYFLDRI